MVAWLRATSVSRVHSRLHRFSAAIFQLDSCPVSRRWSGKPFLRFVVLRRPPSIDFADTTLSRVRDTLRLYTPGKGVTYLHAQRLHVYDRRAPTDTYLPSACLFVGQLVNGETIILGEEIREQRRRRNARSLRSRGLIESALRVPADDYDTTLSNKSADL